MTEQTRIGQPFDEFNKPLVFELRLDDYFQGLNLDPTGIHPLYYFTTSGDATRKVIQFKRDIISAIQKLPEHKDVLEKALSQCLQLTKDLIAARGPDKFLETEWSTDHRILCLPKNPRNPRP